jgi:hypothetical protein
MADRATDDDENRDKGSFRPVDYVAHAHRVSGFYATLQMVDADGEEIGHSQRLWLMRAEDLSAVTTRFAIREDGTFTDVAGRRYVRKE